MFTRVRAELEDDAGGFSKARDLMQSTREFISRLEQVINDREIEAERGLRAATTTKVLDFATFERLAEIFLRDVSEIQGTFPFLKSVE